MGGGSTPETDESLIGGAVVIYLFVVSVNNDDIGVNSQF